MFAMRSSSFLSLFSLSLLISGVLVDAKVVSPFGTAAKSGQLNWDNKHTYDPITIHWGDSIQFRFSEIHNVMYTTNIGGYATCSGGSQKAGYGDSPYTFHSSTLALASLPRTVYFYCAAHCSQGQKVAVKVVYKGTHFPTHHSNATATAKPSKRPTVSPYANSTYEYGNGTYEYGNGTYEYGYGNVSYVPTFSPTPYKKTFSPSFNKTTLKPTKNKNYTAPTTHVPSRRTLYSKAYAAGYYKTTFPTASPSNSTYNYTLAPTTYNATLAPHGCQFATVAPSVYNATTLAPSIYNYTSYVPTFSPTVYNTTAPCNFTSAPSVYNATFAPSVYNTTETPTTYNASATPSYYSPSASPTSIYSSPTISPTPYSGAWRRLIRRN